MMTSAQVVETLVSVTTNSPSQDYTYPNDHNLPTYGVEQSLIAIKLSIQCQLAISLSSGVNNNIQFIWPECAAAFNIFIFRVAKQLALA